MAEPTTIERLSYQECLSFPEQLDFDGIIELNPQKHAFEGLRDQELVWRLKLPLPFPAIEHREISLEDYLSTVEEEIPSYSIALIQAGAAALGYFEYGEVVHHKAIKKYMKRHKRGKSQINYLKTRGKSKAGSRIRLANSVRFFEEINERLTEWEEEFQPTRILYSCTATLWGFLFQSNVPPPFEKKDDRLIKIPRDVRIPSYEELLRINQFVIHGWLEKYR